MFKTMKKRKVKYTFLIGGFVLTGVGVILNYIFHPYGSEWGMTFTTVGLSLTAIGCLVS